MKQKIIGKGLAVAVILLFLGLAIQPSIAVQPDTEIDIEPKDYLFQTIIEIANNPEVKELFEQYKPEMFNFDIDRSIYRKIFFRNPRLLFDTLFTKPSMSVEYLNKCYNNGIGITNILGEDKVIEIIENVEVTDTRFYDELNNIISKDEELSGRFETLKDMNKELDYEDYPILCSVLVAYIIFTIIIFAPFDFIFSKLIAAGLNIVYWILNLITMPLLLPISIVYIIVVTIVLVLDCFNFYLYPYN